YLRIVLRDKPVRRSISRIGIPSRKCHRRITLNNAMSITPWSPDPTARGKLRTWVNSQWKFPPARVSSQRKSTIEDERGKPCLCERLGKPTEIHLLHCREAVRHHDGW